MVPIVYRRETDAVPMRYWCDTELIPLLHRRDSDVIPKRPLCGLQKGFAPSARRSKLMDKC